jgi:glycosyltransferase involved in cell wall biosynthesis
MNDLPGRNGPGRGAGKAIKVAFVVNGPRGSAMDCRALAFARLLSDEFDIRLFRRLPGSLRATWGFAAELKRFWPRVCYVFDMALAGVGGGLAAKALTRSRLVIDTGDAITALAVALGRGPLGRLATACLERTSLAVADHVVVRGTYHREWLARRGVTATVIQDGVETDLFMPQDVGALRRELGLADVLTVGLVGVVNWNSRDQSCYGWDLVESLRLLKGQPVVGVLIGDGSGVPHLQERCRRYGIDDHMRFLGRIPYERLPPYLNLMDVCLSTQTDDLIGRVRTTGKLPLYLACGRYVLASRVGEAALVLEDAMLVDYHGAVDPEYPGRLAERLAGLVQDRQRLECGRANVAIARTQFDYALLAERLRGVLRTVAH